MNRSCTANPVCPFSGDENSERSNEPENDLVEERRRIRLNRVGAVAVAVALASFVSSPAQAITLTTVADLSTPIPDGAGNVFDNFGAIGTSGSNVVFYGEGPGLRGMYGLIDGALVVIADNQTLIPDGGSDLFETFENVVALSGNNVVFSASGALGSKRGVYALIGGQLQVIADLNTLMPGSSDLFGDFPGQVAISGANVVFDGGNGFVPRYGVYARFAGNLRVIADSDTLIPDGGCDLFDLNFGSVAISGSNVVFQGGNGFVPKGGVYGRIGGQLQTIADSNTVIPDGGSDLFDLNFTGVAISGSNVVFQGGNGFVPKAGVYGRFGGPLRVVADSDTVILGGGSDLFDLNFGAVSISGSTVVFQGGNGFVPKGGVYARIGGQLRVIADNNTVIPDGGSDLFDLNFMGVGVSGPNVVFQGGNGFVPKAGVYGRLAP